MTWTELVDRYVDSVLEAGGSTFTARGMARWWLSSHLVRPTADVEEVRRWASSALADHVALQRRPRQGGYQVRHVVHSTGYGPAAEWEVLAPDGAMRALQADARDAAERLVRDVAAHAIAAAEPDTEQRVLVERTAELVGRQLELLVLQVGG
jgi:hypothetical protein